MRAEEEYRSAAIFAELTAAFIDGGGALDLAGGLSQIVGDELRHAALCSHLADQFRAAAPRVRVAPVRDRVARSRGDRKALTCSLLLIEGAIGETISSALFSAGRHGTREPCSRAALATILRDEARHARFFWEAVAILGPNMVAGGGEQINEELRFFLGALEVQQALPSLKRLSAGQPFDEALERLGVLPPERRVETFYHAVERGVLPRLDRLGFDGARSWRDRHRAPPASR